MFLSLKNNRASSTLLLVIALPWKAIVREKVYCICFLPVQRTFICSHYVQLHVAAYLDYSIRMENSTKALA